MSLFVFLYLLLVAKLSSVDTPYFYPFVFKGDGNTVNREEMTVTLFNDGNLCSNFCVKKAGVWRLLVFFVKSNIKEAV